MISVLCGRFLCAHVWCVWCVGLLCGLSVRLCGVSGAPHRPHTPHTPHVCGCVGPHTVLLKYTVHLRSPYVVFSLFYCASNNLPGVDRQQHVRPTKTRQKVAGHEKLMSYMLLHKNLY
jgi:hypothetical protein